MKDMKLLDDKKSTKLSKYIERLDEEGDSRKAGMVSYVSGYMDGVDPADMTYGDFLEVLGSRTLHPDEILYIGDKGLFNRDEVKIIESAYSDIRGLSGRLRESLDTATERQIRLSNVDYKKNGVIGYRFDTEKAEKLMKASPEMFERYVRDSDLNSYSIALIDAWFSDGMNVNDVARRAKIFKELRLINKHHVKSNNPTVGEVLDAVERGKLPREDASLVRDRGIIQGNVVIKKAFEKAYPELFCAV